MINSREIVATYIAPDGATVHNDIIQKSLRHLQYSGATELKTLSRRKDQSVDLYFKDLDLTSIHKELRSIVGEQPIDLIVQFSKNRQKKILIADMESTIIQQEMLDELASMIGIKEKVAEITRQAMNGELDFSNALKNRAILLRDLPISILEKAGRLMTLTPGAQQLVAEMRASGAKAWLVSGGFNYFVKIISQQLEFDQFYANELKIRNDIITGEVNEPILDKNEKLRLTLKAVSALGITMSSVLTLGDGANDIPMLKAAEEGGGLGVAYRAKPLVRETIRNQINYCDLTALLDAQDL